MKVAIVGAGPSGAALAILLARQGARVTLFDDGRRPELLVGESLVPAVVPILQRLGLEEETASFSRVKPGVSFIWSPTDRFSFSFARFAPACSRTPTTFRARDSTTRCSRAPSPAAWSAW